jgi:modulator of FtsH protease HflC
MDVEPEPASKRSAHPRGAGRVTSAALVAVVLLWAVGASMFAVDVTEYGVVERFGAIVKVVPAAGLHFKLPFDRVVRVDKRLTVSRPAPAEYLTLDKKNIVVESLATWRIAEPGRFLATLATRAGAEPRLGDLILGEIGAVLGKHPAVELIEPDGKTDRFDGIVAEIRGNIARFAREAYGVEVADVALLRLSLPDQNRQHVFDRMKAERGRMATELRTAGELAAKKITAKADHERVRIEAEAYAGAQRLRGDGDAQASRIYAAAYSHDPSFYKFRRTLQAYQKFLDGGTTLFLPGEAEVLRVLRPQSGPSGGSHAPATTAATRSREPAPALSVARHARRTAEPTLADPPEAQENAQ